MQHKFAHRPISTGAGSRASKEKEEKFVAEKRKEDKNKNNWIGVLRTLSVWLFVTNGLLVHSLEVSRYMTNVRVNPRPITIDCVRNDDIDNVFCAHSYLL